MYEYTCNYLNLFLAILLIFLNSIFFSFSPRHLSHLQDQFIAGMVTSFP